MSHELGSNWDTTAPDTMPVPPAVPALPSQSDAFYSITIPDDDDVANVPGDMEALAKDIIRELNLRLTEAGARNAYQTKVVVMSRAPTAADNLPDGTVIFVTA